MPHTKPSFKRAVKAAFYKTYPFPGFDQVENTRSSKSQLTDSELEAYLGQPLTYFITFCAFRNKIPKDGKSTWKGLLKNMFFWPDKALSWPKKIAYGLGGGILGLLYFSIVTVSAFLVHIAKLVTEFAPAIGIVYFNQKLEQYNREWEKHNREMNQYNRKIEQNKKTQLNEAFFQKPQPLTWQKRLGYGASCAAYGFFRTWHFIGRSFTSPVNGMRAAYKDGKKFGGEGKLGIVCSVGLTLLSGGMSVVGGFILPKIIHHVAVSYAVKVIPNAVQTIFSNISAAVVVKATSGGGVIASMSTMLSTIGQNATPFMNMVTGLSSQGSNLATGISFVTSTFLNTYFAVVGVMRIGMTTSRDAKYQRGLYKAPSPRVRKRAQEIVEEVKPAKKSKAKESVMSALPQNTAKITRALQDAAEQHHNRKSQQTFSPSTIVDINERARVIQEYNREPKEKLIHERNRDWLKVNYESNESKEREAFVNSQNTVKAPQPSSFPDSVRKWLRVFNNDTDADRSLRRSQQKQFAAFK